MSEVGLVPWQVCTHFDSINTAPRVSFQDLELAREYNLSERAYCPLCLSLFSGVPNRIVLSRTGFRRRHHFRIRFFRMLFRLFTLNYN